MHPALQPFSTGFIGCSHDRKIDRSSYLYSAYKSKESLGASVAKTMCFQRSSKRIEAEFRPPKPGWKVIPQSRTGSREKLLSPSLLCAHGTINFRMSLEWSCVWLV